MQPCPECSDELVTVWIALAVIVGASVVWISWRDSSWGIRLLILLGATTLLGAGMVACHLGSNSRNEAPPCPCMTAAKRAADPVFLYPQSPPVPAVREPLATQSSVEPGAASTASEARPVTGSDPGEAAASRVLPPEVIVYYFHRKLRCHSCLQIEDWAKQAVETNFATPLAVGIVEWKPVNVEEPGNEHFIKDYRLDAQSLVMVRCNDGRPGSWKKLEKVWDLLGDYGKFTTYVQDELSGMLDSTSTAPNP